MQPSIPPRTAAQTRSPVELPGPRRVLLRRVATGPSGTSPLDRLLVLPWLQPEASSPAADPTETTDTPGGEDASERAAGLSLTTASREVDDDVHFGVAARALGVSRKTVERMVKRGQLERGPSSAPATVSKRALVAVLEQRRRDVSTLTAAAEVEPASPGGESPGGDLPQPQSSSLVLQQLLVPVLRPLLDEIVAVRTQTAVLERQLEELKDRAERERRRYELMLAFVTSGWWGRRRARNALLRHLIAGDDQSPGSETD
jgi:hypothetical protein